MDGETRTTANKINILSNISIDKNPLASAILGATHDPRTNIMRIDNFIDLCSVKNPPVIVSDNSKELNSKINEKYVKPLCKILRSIADEDNVNLLDIINNDIKNNKNLTNLINNGRKINDRDPVKPEECNDSLKMIFNEIKYYSDNIYNIANNYSHQSTFLDETTNKIVSIQDKSMEAFKELIYSFKNDIDDIPYFLNIDKIEAKKEKIHLLDLIIKTKESLCKSHFNKDHPIIIFSSDESRESYIDTDPKLFSKAIENILGNAIKYLPKDDIDSPITIILDNQKIIIKDKGIGINKDDLPEINKFKAGNRTHKAWVHAKGTGAGLYVANKCLRKNGLKLGISSRSIEEYPTDHGTEVTIFLNDTNLQ